MNESILKLLQDRYFLSHEKEWDDIAKRVSSIYPEIYEDIRDMYFIPSSPTLMNCGTKRGTLSSCFPMGIEDSIEGIFDAIKEGAIVTKNSGGVGYDFSVLRGSKENIKTLDSNSSGPLAFIESFNAMLDSIRQGGKRRGAGAGLLDISHPDILKFINAKKDTSKINRLNLSIKIGKEFYDRLENTPNSPHIIKNVTNDIQQELIDEDGNIVTVKQIWDMIIDSAYNVAEPGIFNKDIAYNRCTVTNVNKNVLMNPCLRDTVWLLTKKGLQQLKDINIDDMVWSSEGWTKVLNKWKTGHKEVFEYATTSGIFESTENHEVVSCGEKIPIKDTKNIDILLGEYIPKQQKFSQYIMDGLVLGDGSCHKASNNLIYLCIGKNDQDYFDSEIKDLLLKDRSKAFKCGWEIKTTITSDDLNKTYDRFIPDRFIIEERDKIYSFLRGLYSANGSICGGRVTYKSASFKLIQQLHLLLSSLGIQSYWTTNKETKVQFSNGDYVCKQSYDLNITKDINKFYESIGFLQKYKNDKLCTILENKKRKGKLKNNHTIVNIQSLGYHDVFDITVNNTSHTFWCNGFNISNCSEFTGIPYQSCNLGSVNLSKLIDNKNFNWEKFEKTIIYVTRYLNCVIDNNYFPLNKIKDITLKTRPLGGGFMGLAHALYKKQIPYNSDKALKFVDEMNRFLTLRSMVESVELAKKDGAYEAFDYDLFMKANERFFTKACRNIDIDKLQKDIKKYGVRNSSFTSIAPTGSISTIAQTSGGIEPVFALTFIRKIEKQNKEYELMYVADQIFEKYLNETFNEEKKTKILQEVYENNGSCQQCKMIPEEIRKVFVVAGDLTPMEHLDMLEVCANATSLSVSKTINLPKDCKKEDISEVFLQAHKRGIIGCTIYRDGSREGILVHNLENKEDIVEVHAPKRPKSLPCHIDRIKVNGEKWIIFIGLLNNKPYEVFSGRVKMVDIPSFIDCGNIIKEKKGLYSFEYNGETFIKDISSLFECGEQESITRLISTGLRHGVPIRFINQQLSKSYGTVVDFQKSILKSFKKYLKDENTNERCINCGGKIIYTDGCKKCLDCGVGYCG